VDPSVVSRVVNSDAALNITDQTRERILTALAELDYRPNLFARGLRMARTWTIGFLLPDLTNPAYGPLVEGARATAEAAGYVIVLGSAQDGTVAESSFARLLSRGRVDGLIIASATAHEDFFRDLATGPSPIVVVNRQVEGIDSCVVLQDAWGARLATEHLIGLGHQNIAHIAGPPAIDTTVRRLEGFRSVVAEHPGIEATVVHASAWDAAAGYRATEQLLAVAPATTAIYAVNVMIAIGVMRALHSSGRRIPEDVSIIGFHDYPLAAYLQPPLTTVSMPFREAGSAAVELLLDLLSGGPPSGRVIETPPHLVLRQSTATPPLARGGTL